MEKTWVTSKQIKALKTELNKRFWVGFVCGLGLGLVIMAFALYFSL
jgi:hypothetical protein